jgi:hypothetical protein
MRTFAGSFYILFPRNFYHQLNIFVANSQIQVCLDNYITRNSSGNKMNKFAAIIHVIEVTL